MLQSAQLVRQYTATAGKAEFIADVQLQDSVIRCLMVIAEAACRISPATRDRLSNIAWHEI
ncbi:MAG: HepT-like ribonuclease domain-containing protein [Cyanobacteria bacterium P01_C01_bin.89]